MHRCVLPALLIVCAFFSIGRGWAAEEVGRASFVRGTATKQTAQGIKLALTSGTLVFNGEIIHTDPRSAVVLVFNDKTRFTLGPRAALRIDQVNTGANEGFSVEVLAGAFRFVTGLIAKRRPSAMRVAMGVVATIGIRGTTVGGEVRGESATVVLLAPEAGSAPSAVEVANEHGSVVLTEEGTGTRVPDARSPPSPPERMRLRAVENLMRNLSTLQRNVAPRPMLR